VAHRRRAHRRAGRGHGQADHESFPFHYRKGERSGVHDDARPGRKQLCGRHLLPQGRRHHVPCRERGSERRLKPLAQSLKPALLAALTALLLSGCSLLPEEKIEAIPTLIEPPPSRAVTYPVER